MVFSSTIFLFIFLPLCWLGHLALPSVRAMNALLFGDIDACSELRSLFCTAYGSIITYFCTRKDW